MYVLKPFNVLHKEIVFKEHLFIYIYKNRNQKFLEIFKRLKLYSLVHKMPVNVKLFLK